jgi:hypothetical protein
MNWRKDLSLSEQALLLEHIRLTRAVFDVLFSEDHTPEGEVALRKASEAWDNFQEENRDFLVRNRLRTPPDLLELFDAEGFTNPDGNSFTKREDDREDDRTPDDDNLGR